MTGSGEELFKDAINIVSGLRNWMRKNFGEEFEERAMAGIMEASEKLKIEKCEEDQSRTMSH
ncbi:MAG: hypothetical protein PHY47_20590 [Lachnospiraceae bacterium]|jgi:hypothetical protein|nr:hypothetical protein [Lachnospiraceae bacterium]